MLSPFKLHENWPPTLKNKQMNGKGVVLKKRVTSTCPLFLRALFCLALCGPIGSDECRLWNSQIDAAFYNEEEGEIWLFSGEEYAIYDDIFLSPSPPREIHLIEELGLPWGEEMEIGAALYWKEEGLVYYFYGLEYVFMNGSLLGNPGELTEHPEWNEHDLGKLRTLPFAALFWARSPSERALCGINVGSNS